MERSIYTICTLLAAIGLTNVAHAQMPQQTSEPTSMAMENNDALFQQLGGKVGISKIIDDFLVVWQADPRISAKLQEADVERLGLLLKEQINQLAGGPAVYSGKDMKTAHAQMGLRNVDFNALAEDLQTAMEKNDVASRAQNKLLAKLAPMEHVIVTK